MIVATEVDLSMYIVMKIQCVMLEKAKCSSCSGEERV